MFLSVTLLSLTFHELCVHRIVNYFQNGYHISDTERATSWKVTFSLSAPSISWSDLKTIQANREQRETLVIPMEKHFSLPENWSSIWNLLKACYTVLQTFSSAYILPLLRLLTKEDEGDPFHTKGFLEGAIFQAIWFSAMNNGLIGGLGAMQDHRTGREQNIILKVKDVYEPESGILKYLKKYNKYWKYFKV